MIIQAGSTKFRLNPHITMYIYSILYLSTILVTFLEYFNFMLYSPTFQSELLFFLHHYIYLIELLVTLPIQSINIKYNKLISYDVID